MSITLAQICDAIESTLDDAGTIRRSESYNELGDGLHDLPLLQVYPENGGQSAESGTDRHTFQAFVRQTEVTIHADYFARQRSDIGEDMKALVDGIDAMTVIFEGQDQKPYFGLDGIKSFSWRWDRIPWEYSGVLYMGARFTITVRVF